MPDSDKDWVVIALADIRQKSDEQGASLRRDIAELRSELRTRLDGVEHAQEEYAKKEYAAALVAKILHRALRLFYYVVVLPVGGYALTHWGKIKAYLEGAK